LSQKAHPNSAGTPIAGPLRLWFVAEVLFSLGAVVSIVADPANTAANFAWDIQPVVMAAVIGAYYVSAAPLTLLPLFARRWEMIRVVVLPAAAFTFALLVATLLHWSRFSHGTPPFIVWFLSYLLPPPIFLAFYFFHERRARPAAAQPPTDPLAPDARQALLVWGGLLTAVTVFLFLVPQALMAVAPWEMTPLTARVFVSFLLAAGVLMLSMARENDRAGVLMGVPMLLLMFPAVTVQLARFHDQVNFSNAALFGLYAFLLIAFVLGVHLAGADWRRAFR
jgi:hypothetical protein